MTDKAILTARLAEAEDALHRLTMGARIASIEYEGRKVGYTPASSDKLRAYIVDLKRQLGVLPRRRAIRVTF